MGKIQAAHPDLDVNKPRTFDTFIKMTFGTQDAADRVLKLTLKTCNRWYKTMPRKFLYVLPELMYYSNMEAKEIMDLIIQRQEDVDALRSHEHSRPETNA
tara:strand:+ start:2598 stop:2897 length:300 start_codon:yes stop_codon:yes gene_type:complete